MSSIKVFTLGNCPNCPAAKEIAQEVAEKLDIPFEVIDIEEDPLTGLKFQVMSTPSIAIGDETVFFGDVPSIEELKEAVEKRLA